jgi:hypothetical protein
MLSPHCCSGTEAVAPQYEMRLNSMERRHEAKLKQMEVKLTAVENSNIALVKQVRGSHITLAKQKTVCASDSDISGVRGRTRSSNSRAWRF